MHCSRERSLICPDLLLEAIEKGNNSIWDHQGLSALHNTSEPGSVILLRADKLAAKHGARICCLSEITVVSFTSNMWVTVCSTIVSWLPGTTDTFSASQWVHKLSSVVADCQVIAWKHWKWLRMRPAVLIKDWMWRRSMRKMTGNKTLSRIHFLLYCKSDPWGT